MGPVPDDCDAARVDSEVVLRMLREPRVDHDDVIGLSQDPGFGSIDERRQASAQLTGLGRAQSVEVLHPQHHGCARSKEPGPDDKCRRGQKCRT